jgi:hypothetical protein
MEIICFIRTIIRSITTLKIVSGHNYQEIYSNKDIQVLKCETCNRISVGFYKEI